MQKGRERWGRGLPRNPRCKEAVERGWETAQGSSSKRRPPHQWWLGRRGGMGTRSWGTARDEGNPAGGSAPQQCGAGGRGAQFLYSAALGMPAPSPPPRSPASSPLAREGGSYICKYGEMAWARPLPPLWNWRSLLYPHPRYWTGWSGQARGDRGRVWAEWRERLPQRERDCEGSRHTLRWGPQAES